MRILTTRLIRSTTLPSHQFTYRYSQLRSAMRKGCTTAQVALAWVAAQGMIAIPGMTKVSRLEENWMSREVVLSAEEMAEMRRIVEMAKPRGERYGDDNMAMVGNSGGRDWRLLIWDISSGKSTLEIMRAARVS
jgi:hypothetical protein